MLQKTDFFNTSIRYVIEAANTERNEAMALQPVYRIPKLPPKGDLETPAVLRAAAPAHRHLAELKGRASAIPNQGILIDTLSLQEAQASSEIENIVTTQDEMFQARLFPDGPSSAAGKEVARYSDALKLGFDRIGESGGLITNNTIIDMFRTLKRTTEGFRTKPGTALLHDTTGKIVYVPPQNHAAIVDSMNALEAFINDDEACDLDPLIKMAIIHHQFESIHPFTDGNGRIGRILNVLYLTQQRLLDIPILYLSRYITTHKSRYYELLQSTRDSGAWEPWVLFMLEAVSKTSRRSLTLIEGIRVLMSQYKNTIRTEHAAIYSQDLLNNLFRHPYTRIEFMRDELGVTRQTAARYLDRLANAGLVQKHTSGRSNYYVNTPLVRLFTRDAEAKPHTRASKA